MSRKPSGALLSCVPLVEAKTLINKQSLQALVTGSTHSRVRDLLSVDAVRGVLPTAQLLRTTGPILALSVYAPEKHCLQQLRHRAVLCTKVAQQLSLTAVSRLN